MKTIIQKKLGFCDVDPYLSVLWCLGVESNYHTPVFQTGA